MCATCLDYEFVENPADPDGPKIDCPDCRGAEIEPRRFCPAHGRRLQPDGRCRSCAREAAVGAEILLERARAAAQREELEFSC